MRDILRDLWRSVTRDRMRVMLTLWGIVLGAAAIVFLASALWGTSVLLTSTSQAEAGEDMSHIHAQPPHLRSAAQTFRDLSESDIRAVGMNDGVSRQDIAGGNYVERAEASRRDKRMFVSIQSGDARWAEIGGFHIGHGRFLRDEDGAERVAVIGHDIWQELFGGAWPLEEPTFQVFGALTLRVVGVMKQRPPLEGGGGDGSWMHDRRIWITNATYARGIRAAAPFEEILIRHAPKNGAPPNLRVVAARLTPMLQTLHLGVKNFEFDALNQGAQLWELLTWALGAILFGCGLCCMFVGAVNVMNSQLMSFGERTKEFGLRRALGESTRGLQFRVAVEAMIMASFGGAIGVVFGTGAAWALSAALVAADIAWPFRVVWWSILAALALSSAVGLVAGLVPAWRASKLMPSEALRAD